MATDLRLPTDRIVRPDKDRFLNEENPFEAMMSRFDRAAELLDLEPGLYKVLRHPEKQIIISVPVMMDSGEVEVYTGYRVLYNTSTSPLSIMTGTEMMICFSGCRRTLYKPGSR